MRVPIVSVMNMVSFRSLAFAGVTANIPASEKAAQRARRHPAMGVRAVAA